MIPTLTISNASETGQSVAILAKNWVYSPRTRHGLNNPDVRGKTLRHDVCLVTKEVYGRVLMSGGEVRVSGLNYLVLPLNRRPHVRGRAERLPALSSLRRDNPTLFPEVQMSCELSLLY